MKRLLILMAIIFTSMTISFGTAFAAEEWNGAYYGVLTELIPEYANFKGCNFIVDDVTGDGIPELLLIGIFDYKTRTLAPMLRVYQYKDQKAELIWDDSKIEGYSNFRVCKAKNKTTGKTEYFAVFSGYTIKAELYTGSVVSMKKVCSVLNYDFYSEAMESKYEDGSDILALHGALKKDNELLLLNYYPLNAAGVQEAGIVPPEPDTPQNPLEPAAPAEPAAVADKLTVKLNGGEIKFSVEPQLIEGRIYVEMRSLLDILGYSLDYNQQTKDITAKKNGVQFTITKSDEGDYPYCAVYDAPNNYNTDMKIEMEWPPKTINSRTMLPLRSIAGLFGMKVDWNDASKTAYLTSIKPGEGTHFVSVSGVSSDNRLMITEFYYDAGRQLETGGPTMVPIEGSNPMNIPLNLGARYGYFSEEPTRVSEADIGKYINRDFPRYYKINIVEGAVVYFEEFS